MASVPKIVWVFDTSSIIQVRRLQNTDKPAVFARLTELVDAARLIYPVEVVEELKRSADPDAPDQQYLWAKNNSEKATSRAKCTLDEVKAVLAVVPDVLDPNKDGGVEEADPYVLVQMCAQREVVVLLSRESRQVEDVHELDGALVLAAWPRIVPRKDVPIVLGSQAARTGR